MQTVLVIVYISCIGCKFSMDALSWRCLERRIPEPHRPLYYPLTHDPKSSSALFYASICPSLRWNGQISWNVLNPELAASSICWQMASALACDWIIHAVLGEVMILRIIIKKKSLSLVWKWHFLHPFLSVSLYWTDIRLKTTRLLMCV